MCRRPRRRNITRAYRTLAHRLHPNADPGNSAAAERFAAMNQAHALLSDPPTRAEYGQVRRLSRSGDATAPVRAPTAELASAQRVSTSPARSAPIHSPPAARRISRTGSQTCFGAEPEPPPPTESTRGVAPISKPRSAVFPAANHWNGTAASHQPAGRVRELRWQWHSP